jgi:hypothetical protein
MASWINLGNLRIALNLLCNFINLYPQKEFNIIEELSQEKVAK